MINDSQLLEIIPEQSLDFIRAVIDNNEEIKFDGEEVEEVGKWNEILEATTSSFELFGKDKVANVPLTLLQTHELLKNNIIDKNKQYEILKEDIKEKEKGEISNSERIRKAQIEQVQEAPSSMKIKYASHVWDKIRTWVEMTKEEISGMGCVRREKDGSFYIYDVFLLKQENTGAFTDIDDEALMSLMWEMDQLDEEDNGTRYNDLKYWWHSHANMSTFWSGQDERCIQTKLQHANWWLSTVHNIKGDTTTRLDLSNPPMRFDNLKCELDRSVSKEIKEFCRKEYEEKVTEKSSYSHNSSCSYGNIYPEPYGSYWKNLKKSQKNIQPRQQTQTQQTSQNSSKISLRSLKFATIVNLSDPLAFVNATPIKAESIYKEEINIGKLYLNERMNYMLIDKINFIGLAYNPREASNKIDGTEWTISGKICCGKNKNCYILVVWNDNPETICLSEITEIRHRTEKGDLMTVRSIEVGNDKFVNLSIKCSPENIIPNNDVLQPCIGIIFETEKPIPFLQLGEDFLDSSDYNSYENVFEEEKITEEIEKDITETKELFDDLTVYAEKTSNSSLEERILKKIIHTDKEILVEILGILAINMALNADEQALDEEAEWLEQKDLEEKIKMFVKRNPREAFPYVWSLIPYMYICEKCYEPTTKETLTCPYCGEELSEVID
jgi:proteasome lid subunit RPN8/RPN11